MPLYDYRCDTCGALMELARPVDRRDDAAACEACGASARREFAACAIRQPCADWAKLTARDILGRDQKSSRVIVNKGLPKPVVR